LQRSDDVRSKFSGADKPIWRNGQDDGDRGHASAPALPFDLVKRMATAEEWLAGRKKKAGTVKKPAASHVLSHFGANVSSAARQFLSCLGKRAGHRRRRYRGDSLTALM
jgi:hypothetical protein